VECTSVFDENGRFNPQFNEANTMTMDVDSVIIAIGQKPDLSFIQPEDQIETTPYGTIKIDSDTLATTAPGVYAGGDVAFGARILIEAVANGKKAAQSITNHLLGGEYRSHLTVTIDKIPISEYRMPEAYELKQREHPKAIPNNRRTGITEVELVFDEHEAQIQADRCLVCHVETVYDAELCILCGRCVDLCPEECLKLVPIDQVEIENGAAILKEQGIDPGWSNQDYSIMLKDHDRCIRCGLCALRCPTEAFTMERFSFDETII